MKSRWRMPLYALVPCLLVAAAVELGARVGFTEDELRIGYESRVFTDHPTRLWTYKKNYETIREKGVRFATNSLGLRHGEVELPRPDGLYRILSLGESSTMGHGVEREGAYSGLLETYLNKTAPPGQQFEVINAGVEAWTVWQSSVYLSEAGLDLEPNMVIVYHQTNDFLPAYVIDPANFVYKLDGTDRELYERRRVVAPLLALLYHSRAYLALRHHLLMQPSDLPKMSRGMEPTQQRVPTEDRWEALRRMAAACEEQGALMVILQPYYDQHSGADTLLKDFSDEAGLPYVSIRDLIDHHRFGKSEGMFEIDRIHPNALGHRAIADAVYRALRPVILKDIQAHPVAARH